MKKGLLLLMTIVAIFGSTIAQNEKSIKEAATMASPALTAAEADTVKKHWKFGGGAIANLGQVALVNWAAGGQNSISVLLQGNAFANYRKGRFAWDNSLSLAWGIIAQGKLKDLQANRYPIRKNQDQLIITSKAGYVLDKKGHWLASGIVDFKSGITNGWDFSAYDDDKVSPRQRLSKFAAPAYLITSVGVTWKPLSYFSIYLSPIAGRFTFVTKDVPGAVSSTDIDETNYGLNKGDWARAEVGAYLRADFQKDLFKNVNFKTTVELFQNYTEKHKLDVLVQDEIDANAGSPIVIYPDGQVVDLSKKLYYDNRKNTDVNWTTMLAFSVNKFLQANIATQLIYDHDAILIKTDKNGNTYKGRGTQFREALSIGLGYTF